MGRGLHSRCQDHPPANASPLPSNRPPRGPKASAALDAEEERLLDAYREKVIDLAQLKRQMGKLTEKRAHHKAIREALARRTEPVERPRITRDMLGDLSARYRRAMTNADFTAHRQIVESLVTEVTLYPGRAVVSGVIPIDDGGLRPLYRAPARSPRRAARRQVDASLMPVPLGRRPRRPPRAAPWRPTLRIDVSRDLC
jgi:hypothetical protein